MMNRYFRPDLGLCRRDNTGRLTVDETPDQVRYDEVTHLRAVPLVRDSLETDGMLLRGIFSPFDEETVIRSWWEGEFREVMRRGAFAQTLREDRQISQFEHGFGFVTDSLPLGPFRTLEETSEGLYAEVEMRDTPLIREVAEAIRDGSVSGASIAFRVRDERRTEGDDDEMELREILNVRLFEAGPVVWPAYETTNVEMVSATPDTNIMEEEPSVPDGTGTGRDDRDGTRPTSAERARLLTL